MHIYANLLKTSLIISGTVAALGVAMSEATHAITLVGDTVAVEHFYPDDESVYQSYSVAVAADSSDLVEFFYDFPNVYEVDMGVSGVAINFSTSLGFIGSTFNGLVLSDLDFSDFSNIVDVVLETNVTGFDASRVSWTSASV